jgi:hypothetical protein
MNCDLTEQFLDTLYDTLSKEQMRLMTDLKNTKDETGKDIDIQKQLSILTPLMIGCLKLRNLKKKIQMKGNC